MSSNNDGFLEFRYSFVSMAEHFFVFLSLQFDGVPIADPFLVMQVYIWMFYFNYKLQIVAQIQIPSNCTVSQKLRFRQKVLVVLLSII